MPQWYRQKPVTVQARTWDPDDVDAVADTVAWIEVNGGRGAVNHQGQLAVFHPDPAGPGFRIAYPGDMVVRNPDGEFVTMNAGVFAAQFEPVG